LGGSTGAVGVLIAAGLTAAATTTDVGDTGTDGGVIIGTDDGAMPHNVLSS
jgi:hypothetical protein